MSSNVCNSCDSSNSLDSIASSADFDNSNSSTCRDKDSLSVNIILAKEISLAISIFSQRDISVNIIFSQRDISVNMVFSQRDISVNITFLFLYCMSQVSIYVTGAHKTFLNTQFTWEAYMRGLQRHLGAISGGGHRRTWPIDWASDSWINSLLVIIRSCVFFYKIFFLNQIWVFLHNLQLSRYQNKNESRGKIDCRNVASEN